MVVQFYFVLTGSHCVVLTVLNYVDGLASNSQRSPVSASQELRLKVCTTITQPKSLGFGGRVLLCSPAGLRLLYSPNWPHIHGPLGLVSWVLKLQVCTTKPTPRTHFKMSVTLDSLVGQRPALTYCGLKGQNMRSSIKRQFYLPGRGPLTLLGAESKNQALVKPLKFPPTLFQTANGSYIVGSGKESLIFKFHCWSFIMD